MKPALLKSKILPKQEVSDNFRVGEGKVGGSSDPSTVEKWFFEEKKWFFGEKKKLARINRVGGLKNHALEKSGFY